MITSRRLAALGSLLGAALVLGCAAPTAPAQSQAPGGAASAAAASVPASAASGAPAAPSATAAGAPKVPLTFSIPSRNLNYIVPLTAVAKGFFAEEGLDLDVEAIAPNLTVAAMQRGDVKLTGTGGSTIRAVVRGGERFTLTALMTAKPTYFVVTRPELHTAADLVGKRVSVSSLGDTPSLFTEIWLRQNGVDPNDVSFTGLGPNPAVHLAALKAGALDGAVFDPASAAVSEAAGFPVLQALGDVIQDPQQDIVATGELLQNDPDALRAFLKGLVRGLRYTKEHVPEAAAVARQELGLDMDEATSIRAVQLYVDGISAEAPGYADAKQMESFYYYDVRLPLEMGPDEPIPTLHDFRYLLEAYDALGIPRPQ
ncbi:MAG TPA: ABC transporter substrate-binding protein [Chloroflexota bacterium]|nr:ABC transporter substrate-binding protein [Chloroflexota bacterium]